MIGSTRTLRVFAYAAPADLRKGFDGLHGLVVAELGRDPLSGDCGEFPSIAGQQRTPARSVDQKQRLVRQPAQDAGRYASQQPALDHRQPAFAHDDGTELIPLDRFEQIRGDISG